ncbi:alpha-xylosidase [Streptomyces sp. INA 01156]
MGVRVTHHAGKRHPGPDFALTGDPNGAGTVRTDGPVTELTSGPLTLRLDGSGPFTLGFHDADGRELTRADAKGTAFATTGDGAHHMLTRLALGVGEQIYGLGERFTPFVKNGQTVDVWQADGGTSSEQSYKNIPFYVSSRGYGVFVNHPGAVSCEIGSESVGQVQFSVEDQSLEYYVVAGPTPKDVLGRYTALTGRPALPPAWSFGLWLSTSFTTSYDEATVTSFVDGMTERGIPLSVFHFDCFWMREYQWCDFQWDPASSRPGRHAGPAQGEGPAHQRLDQPLHRPEVPALRRAAALGHLVRRPDGDVWQWDLWQAGMGLVDFTGPEARAWFQSKLKALLDQGVDCFKTDFGERIPTDVVWQDGSDPSGCTTTTHSCTTARCSSSSRRSAGRARPCCSPGQRRPAGAVPVHWGGDCWSSFEAMAESLRGGLSLSLSGFGFWSHDIGGFEGTPDPDVFKRWLAFGLLSSHSRLHGSSSYRCRGSSATRRSASPGGSPCSSTA